VITAAQQSGAVAQPPYLDPFVAFSRTRFGLFYPASLRRRLSICQREEINYLKATKMPEPSDTAPHDVLVEMARKTRELYEYLL